MTLVQCVVIHRPYVCLNAVPGIAVRLCVECVMLCVMVTSEGQRVDMPREGIRL